MTQQRKKHLTDSEYSQLSARAWEPTELKSEQIPSFLRNLPDSKLYKAFVSASLDQPNPNADGNAKDGIVGGIDVYRHAEPKDEVLLNKDWYAIYADPINTDKFLVVGPIKDSEHWLDNLPERLFLLHKVDEQVDLNQKAIKIDF